VAKASPKTNTPADRPGADLPRTGGSAPKDDAAVPLSAGKGRPTPSRREREAANRRPIVGATPADRKVARSRLTNERERARVGLANGEERYLPAKDRGEQRRYIRDYVDARWSVGEVLMPVLIVFVLVALIAAGIESYVTSFVWLFVLLFIVDATATWFMLRRRIVAKWGAGAFRRGSFFYVISRQFQMRFLRMPKPQVKRGQYPV
jgi:hypothetical protein